MRLYWPGVGLAVGAAWGGLLANFAAGVFLIVLRPFKVGDHINAGDTEGAVQAIGLFTTTVNTGDNILIHIGNNKIFSDNIKNFSTNPYRRVDLEAQLADSVDPFAARELLLVVLTTIPNVLANPAPVVEIVRFNFAGPVLAVRPFCHDSDYWQVYFDTNKAIAQTFAKAGFPMPAENRIVRTLWFLPQLHNHLLCLCSPSPRPEVESEKLHARHLPRRYFRRGDHSPETSDTLAPEKCHTY